MKAKQLLLCVLLLLATNISAQSHNDLWKQRADNYFPTNHFIVDSNDHWEMLAGEVAYYMYLANIPSWENELAPKGTVWVRISMLPEYANPLFITVEIDKNGGTLQMCRGKAVCGYVEHSTYYEMSDTGFVDVTESHNHGNVWVTGVYGQKDTVLGQAALEQLQSALRESDLPNHRHTTCYGGFRPPYVIEYIDNEHYNAIYDECYPDALGQLVNMIVAWADSSCIDMVVHSPNKRNGIKPAQFPGGEKACQEFIAKNMHYPELALFDGEEASLHFDLIVERDGSVVCKRYDKDDKYGFHEEARRLLAIMPPWQPALKEGKAVRSSASCSFRFKLPAHRQPKYGTPTLETSRDSSQWDGILTLYRRILRHPQNQQNLYVMGMQYYHEFLLPGKPITTPTAFDSMIVEDLGNNRWDSYYDRTPVIKGAADSALRYFYRALKATDSIDLDNYIYMYLPIRQLEQYLHLPHNPDNQLPYDTIPTFHYPATYFANMERLEPYDTVTDLSMSLFGTYFWTDAMSKKLNTVGEPILYNQTVAAGDTLLRFAFYPSFHPPLFFRVEKIAGRIMLHWTKLDYIVDEHTWKATYNPQQGHKQLTDSQYRRIVSLLTELNFDQLPRMYEIDMLDGAQWCIERRTTDSFKAHFTNVAGENYRTLYDYLIELSGVEAGYASEYYE